MTSFNLHLNPVLGELELPNVQWLSSDLINAMSTPSEQPLAAAIAAGRLLRSGYGHQRVGSQVTTWIESWSDEAASLIGSMAFRHTGDILERLHAFCESRGRLQEMLRDARRDPVDHATRHDREEQPPSSHRAPEEDQSGAGRQDDGAPLESSNISAMLAARDDAETLVVVLGIHAVARLDEPGYQASAAWEERILEGLEQLDRTTEVVLDGLLEGVLPESHDDRWLDCIAKRDPARWWLQAWRLLRLREARWRAAGRLLPYMVGSPANDMNVTNLAADDGHAARAYNEPGGPAADGDVIYKDERLQVRIRKVELPENVRFVTLRLTLLKIDPEIDLSVPRSVELRDQEGREVEPIEPAMVNRGLWAAKLNLCDILVVEVPACDLKLRLWLGMS